MLMFSCKRQISRLSVRRQSTAVFRHTHTKKINDDYRIEIPYLTKKLSFTVTPNDTLQDFKEKVQQVDESIKNVEFHSIDSVATSSQFSLSEPMSSFKEMPLLLRLNKADNFVISLVEQDDHKLNLSSDKLFKPNEEAFFNYARSIGIPKQNSEILASFLNETYENISKDTSSTQELKSSIYNALASLRSIPHNKWGTNRVSKLKAILEEKEKELIEMHNTKTKLDKKALRRANIILYMGGTIMISQFSFIVGGTYLYFCWDVMEPMAYLMLTSNLALAFAYYWQTHSELGK
jgi:hypothetical protein